MKKIICSVILSIFAFNTFALSKINSAVEESESQEKVEKPKDDDDDSTGIPVFYNDPDIVPEAQAEPTTGIETETTVNN